MAGLNCQVCHNQIDLNQDKYLFSSKPVNKNKTNGKIFLLICENCRIQKKEKVINNSQKVKITFYKCKNCQKISVIEFNEDLPNVFELEHCWNCFDLMCSYCEDKETSYCKICQDKSSKKELIVLYCDKCKKEINTNSQSYYITTTETIKNTPKGAFNVVEDQWFCCSNCWELAEMDN